MNSKIMWLNDVESTNSFLAEKIQKKGSLPHGFVVCADYQSAGRGQGSNQWESERAKNLLFSLLLKPQSVTVLNQFIISQVVALSLRDTVEKFLQHKVSIKWPNDIYVGDKKIAGILIENFLQGTKIKQSIVGVGLNVNQTSFTSDAPNPISMYQVANIKFDCRVILADFLSHIQAYFTDNIIENSETIRNLYWKHLYRNEGFYPFEDRNNRQFYAKIKTILPNGHLVLERKNNLECFTYAFKEVRFCL